MTRNLLHFDPLAGFEALRREMSDDSLHRGKLPTVDVYTDEDRARRRGPPAELRRKGSRRQRRQRQIGDPGGTTRKGPGQDEEIPGPGKQQQLLPSRTSGRTTHHGRFRKRHTQGECSPGGNPFPHENRRWFQLAQRVVDQDPAAAAEAVASTTASGSCAGRCHSGTTMVLQIPFPPRSA